MPDATGLELLAASWATRRSRPCTSVTARRVVVEPSRIRAVLATLREKGYTFLASVHGVDHYPEEPRLGVIYELLDMSSVDRITVKLRVPSDAPTVPSVTSDRPRAPAGRRPTIRSARSTTCSASCSRAIPTCAGS